MQLMFCYQAPRPYRLTGIHAALELDEVTLITVPDAIQRGWVYRGASQPPAPQPSPSLSQPEWSRFLDCHTRVIEPPSLLLPTCDYLSTLVLRWETNEANLTFVLEEATRPGFEDAITTYTGSEHQYALYHTPGIFYYRVQVSWAINRPTGRTVSSSASNAEPLSAQSIQRNR
jgi:hypothetical protein